MIKPKCGAKAEFSDSEMLTLMLAQDFVPYPSETQFVEYVRARANHRALFPKLLTQSQFNRPARQLRLKVEGFLQDVIDKLGVLDEMDFLQVARNTPPPLGGKTPSVGGWPLRGCCGP